MALSGHITLPLNEGDKYNKNEKKNKRFLSTYLNFILRHL